MPDLNKWYFELRSSFDGGFNQLKYRQYDSTVSKSATVIRPASYVPESAGARHELSEVVMGV